MSKNKKVYVLCDSLEDYQSLVAVYKDEPVDLIMPATEDNIKEKHCEIWDIRSWSRMAQKYSVELNVM